MYVSSQIDNQANQPNKSIAGWLIAAGIATLFASLIVDRTGPLTANTLVSLEWMSIATIGCICKAIGNSLQFPIYTAISAQREIVLRYARRLVILMFGTAGTLIFFGHVFKTLTNLRIIPSWVETIYGGLMVLLAVLGGGLWIAAKRFAAASAREALKTDPRPPIVLLRSFKKDYVRIMPRLSFGLVALLRTLLRSGTLERLVAEVLGPVGPFVAIGRPGQRLPYEGAAREYVEKDWRAQVVSYMNSSALLVFVIGDSAGLEWEITTAVHRNWLTKSIFVTPPIGKTKTKHLWSRIFRLANPDDSALPSESELETALVGYYGPDGSCHLITSKKRREKDYFRALGRAIEEIGQYISFGASSTAASEEADDEKKSVIALGDHGSTSRKAVYPSAYAAVGALLGGAIAGTALLIVSARRLGVMRRAGYLTLGAALMWDLGGLAVPDVWLPLHSMIPPLVVWIGGELLIDQGATAYYRAGGVKPRLISAIAIGFGIGAAKFGFVTFALWWIGNNVA